MELDPQQLKEKALLLLKRERELFELRMKHERITVWLRLTQSLPQLFADSHLTVEDGYARLRKALLDGLRLQRVQFFELQETSLRPLAPAGDPRPFADEARTLVERERVGVINAPDAATSPLAEAVGLSRFIWSRIDVRGAAPVLLAAGYDRSKAKFYPEIDASEAANLRNTVQHIEGLFGNAMLVSQVEQERDRLQQANRLLQVRDGELRGMAEELRAANETLEQRVVERTQQLGRRNRDMRLVLDNVLTALVTIDGAGRLAEERSAKFDQWFGAYQGNPSFVDYIAAADPDFATQFALGHEMLVERALPLELCLDQLPRRLCCRDRHYDCSYRAICGSADDIALLIVIEDVTEQRRLAQEEAEQRELLALFQGVTRDRAGFLTFVEEADRLVRELTGGGAADPAARRRHLHTLKGNAAVMGAKVLADLCHRAEDELAIDGSAIEEIIGRLRERWSSIRQAVAPVLGEAGGSIVEVPIAALEQLAQDVERGRSRAEIGRQMALLWCEPVERPLGRLAQQGKALASRLGKPDLSLVVESDGARVDPRRFAGLWAALVHLIRNAVDHGVEAPDERAAKEKPPGGRVTLRATHTEDTLAIEIEDDGRGIDWAGVAALASARGLPHQTEGDLLRALLADGFSTKTAVSATSGRGVGMTAVHKQVESLGGTLSLRSQRQRGTCWRLCLPLATAAPLTGPAASPEVARVREPLGSPQSL